MAEVVDFPGNPSADKKTTDNFDLVITPDIFKSYVKKSQSFALDSASNATYGVCGLCGETAELAQKLLEKSIQLAYSISNLSQAEVNGKQVGLRLAELSQEINNKRLEMQYAKSQEEVDNIREKLNALIEEFTEQKVSLITPLVKEIFFTDESIDELNSEMGDCWWMCASITTHLPIPSLYALTKTAYTEASDPIDGVDLFSNLPTMNDIIMHCLHLANTLAGKYAKYIRDKDYVSKEESEALLTEITTLLTGYIKILLIWHKALNLTIPAVFDYNTNKLSNRQKNGKITGSGDKR